MASRKLRNYRAKRDFNRTAEPAGGGGTAMQSSRLRFVVQKHAARRLHYDFRLELDGVFRSWAVTRGPSLDPADKRLAVEVEDHPLEYGDFEGTIPQGQYGGGTVQIWDRGYWEPQVKGTPEQALAAGELKLILAGERLSGGWVLVRLRHSRSGKRPSWLLIKHRDEFARRGDGLVLEEESRSVASGRTMDEIAAGAGRGPKAFMMSARSAGRADAVWNSNAASEPRRKSARPRGAHVRMPKFIEPALCRLLPRTEGGNIRQAAFKGLREDKPAREVRAQTAASAEGAEPREPDGRPARAERRHPTGGRAEARGKPAARRGADGPDGPILGVTISNPDKVLWPDAGDGRPVTKREFAEYLAAIGEWLLPHIQGRPCSLVRRPDGIGGQRFFQRHAMPGLSNLISLARVSGDRKPYVQVDRLEGLAALAQIAALELHPWNCVPQQPEVPGRLVFDLDPAPYVSFETVIEAARELRERLDALGLDSFLKTTGGKGLHLVTPFDQPRNKELDWQTVKSFARELCARMAADNPRRYVINMAKRVRASRIFLDYLRNDRTATAVAPLSPRARAGAPVSMPLTWAQARTGLDPEKFTIRTARALLERSDAWEGYAESSRPLLPAIGKLTGAPRRPATAKARARGRAAEPRTGTPP